MQSNPSLKLRAQIGLLVILSYTVVTSQAFVILPTSTSSTTKILPSECTSIVSDSTKGGFEYCHASNHLISLQSKQQDDDDDEEDDIDLSGQDWRAFRAKLVMDSSSKTSKEDEVEEETSSSSSIIVDDNDLDGIGSLFDTDDIERPSSITSTSQPMTTENFTPLNPSQWAYDSGNVIEKGAVILGGVEQDFGFGLRQQYFHKAVILVLDHDHKFTKGIILNRPSDLILVDEKDEKTGVEMKWRVWFGGDVQGLDSIVPEVVCLHSLSSSKVVGDEDEMIDEVSNTVMKDIKWTSFDDAKMLVREGFAKTTDFWVFAGYAGWGPNQLMGELERKSWYMCATDSQTLLKELVNQSALTDPRDAGLDTWELLMNLIGRGETAEESSGDFEDLMLKEWAREKLLSEDAGGNAGVKIQAADVASNKPLVSAVKQFGSFLRKASASSTSSASDDKDAAHADVQDKPEVTIGSLIRAGSKERSPFLLEKQEFHKSIVLVIGDDDAISIGIILNQPSTKAVEMELIDKNTGEKRQLQIPIRFGGMYSIQGQNTLMWLHNSSELKEAYVGSPVGKSKSGIWKCTQNDATSAITKGLAKPSDFIIASGLSVWMKGGEGNVSIQSEVEEGNFEVIPTDKISEVWAKLRSQKDVLTKMNLLQNISYGYDAWSAGSIMDENSSANTVLDDVVTEGIGEGFDEDNDSYVHNSDVRVAKLSDDALRSCKFCVFALFFVFI